MEKITTFAKFVYREKDEDLIIELEKYLNKNAETIFNFFDPSLPKDLVEIRIIPSKKEYNEVVQKIRGTNKTPKWEIGFSHDNVIEYVSLHDYNNTSHAFPPEKYDVNLEHYKKTIVHEYVHYITYLYWKKYKIDWPLRFLNEGIAEYLSLQEENTTPAFKSSLKKILYSQDCYEDWYLLTKFIIEKYGRDFFFELFGSQKKAKSETPRLYDEAKEYYGSLNTYFNPDSSKRV